MKLQLIHIDNYFLVVDDSQPKIGDIVLEEYTDGTKGLEQIDTLNDIDVLLQKRITHHLPLNNAPVLEGIELLPPLDIDLYSYATEEHKFNHKSVQEIGFVLGVKIGYNKAKEDYKYTEEDMVEFGEWCENLQKYNKEIRRNNPSITRKKLLQLWKEQRPKTLYYE